MQQLIAVSSSQSCIPSLVLLCKCRALLLPPDPSASLQVTTLSLTLKGTKPPPESAEGLPVQRNALQHLAAIVEACAPTLKAAFLITCVL